MSIIATALKHLIAAGVSGDDLVRAVAEMEAAAPSKVDQAAERRREKDKAYQANKRRQKSAESADSDDYADVGATPPDKKVSPDPFKELTPPTPETASAVSTPAGVRPAKVEKSGKGQQRRSAARSTASRLAADWQPPAIAELPQPIQAVIHNWPEGAYELVAIKFRNHWTSEGRAIGAKRDWPRTWHNWLINDSADVLRGARAGVNYRAIAPLGEPWSDDKKREYLASLANGPVVLLPMAEAGGVR